MSDFSKIKKIYFIGIKGSGVSAVAQIMKTRGVEVLGSDTKEKFFTDEILKKGDIKILESFDAKNIPSDADLVVYSTAYNESNPEIAEALKRNIPMMSYPEILAELFNEKFGIAVAGTHGKTTTSAMLAEAIRFSGKDPQAVIGSQILGWGSNSMAGKGEYFVLEADEYQNKLSKYTPKAAIITSCDFDHPDYFENYETYKKAFREFAEKIPKTGFLAVWGDSVDTLEISRNCKTELLTYGFSEECDYKISNFQFFPLGGISQSETIFNQFLNPNDQFLKPRQVFSVSHKDINLGSFEIQLVGKHNILNATAVIAVCHKLNLDMEKVREALKNFRGTARRFEIIGERNGAIIIDDYGHHPEEIKATLAGARQIYPEKNVIVVFHPHTFSRTQALLEEFSQCFSDANEVVILDIYGSAREAAGTVHSKDLVVLIERFEKGKAKYIPTISETIKYLKPKIGENDVLITIGAGNVWEVGKRLVTSNQ